MKLNIFWRSTRRQPLRTVLLLLLTVTVVFAFTARVAEYLLVKQETDRLGSYYKAIGEISRLSDAATANMASFDEAKEFLENDPRVAYTSWQRQLSAVMQDIYNADVYGAGSMKECKNLNLYFIGTLLDISEVRGFLHEGPSTPADNGDWDLYCYFREERSLAGAPELVAEGRTVRVFIPKENAPAVLDMLTRGEQYLICGRCDIDTIPTEEIAITKPTVKNPKLGKQRPKWEDTKGGTHVIAQPLAVDGPLFYPIPESGEIDWNDPVLTGVEEELQTCREEQSALWITTTKDMETMSETQPDAWIYLVDGRWLNYEDHAGQNKVCVIHDALAKMRGLSIGDTITMKLRNVDAEDFQWGYLIFPVEGELPPYETATETFQIVGTYENVSPHPQGYDVYRNTVYLPDSTVPEEFDAYSRWLTASSLHFVLTSPEVTEEFVADTREGLAEMTLQADMWDTGWNEFQAAVRPMLQSSLYNLIIFGLILLTTLCLVTFFYLRARRRDVAIARALGVPAGVCIRQSAVPLVLIGFIGTLGGVYLGRQYALRHGAAALVGLDSYGDVPNIALPNGFLAALLGGVLLLILALALGGTAWLTHRPVLTLLQGSTQVKQKEEKTAQMAALDAIPKAAGTAAVPIDGMSGGATSAVPVQPVKRSFGVAHTLRFAGCYIRRSKVKSLLVLLLAVLFTVGLAAIRLSILQSGARIDELFNTVSVQMSLMPKNSGDYRVGGGFISQNTVHRIQDTEFVRDAYLEGGCAVMRIRREDIFAEDSASEEPNTLPRDGDTGWSSEGEITARMISFSDLDGFLSVGNGSKMEITYYDGWDAGMFAKDWSNSGTLPVVMPLDMYEALHIPLGGRVAIDVLRENLGITENWLVEVAGVYTGTLTANQWGETGSYLLSPASVMDTVMRGQTVYRTARFTLNSAWNRELDTVYTAIEEITETSNAEWIPLRPVIWDEELTQAVEPLENSIRLMEMLFPVALALSLLAALGVSGLLILTEAREAAIMRVLGTTKLRSRIILSLQVIFMVLAGLMIGLTVAFVWAGSMGLAWATAGMSLLCAAAYLLCAAAGSATGAVIVTNRPPLELLQVKE